MKLLETGFKDHKDITFSWELTDQCQYRCSYCYVREILKNKIDEKDILKYKNVLKKFKLNSIPGFRVEILGGEPTTHPFFLDILDDLEKNDKCKFLSVNTNLAKPASYYKQFSDKTKYKKLEFSISVHIEYIKNVNKFCDKIKEIYNAGVKCFVNLNLHKDINKIPIYKEILNQCWENNINAGVNYLFSTDNYDSKFTDEYHETIDRELIEPLKHKLGNKEKIYIDHEKFPFVDDKGETKYYDLHEINKYKLKSFKGYNCRPKLWYITKNGVFKNSCTGEIADFLFKNLNKCVKCPLTECACDFMFYYHKTAPGQLKPKE